LRRLCKSDPLKMIEPRQSLPLPFSCEARDFDFHSWLKALWNPKFALSTMPSPGHWTAIKRKEYRDASEILVRIDCSFPDCHCGLWSTGASRCEKRTSNLRQAVLGGSGGGPDLPARDGGHGQWRLLAIGSIVSPGVNVGPIFFAGFAAARAFHWGPGTD
jgi:hypothetical protein